MEIAAQGVPADRIRIAQRLSVKYDGTDSALEVTLADLPTICKSEFERLYRMRFGFLMQQRALIVESISVEAIGAHKRDADASAGVFAPRVGTLTPLAVHPVLLR